MAYRLNILLSLTMALGVSAAAQNSSAAQSSKRPALEAPSASLPRRATENFRPKVTLPSTASAEVQKIVVPRIVLPPLSEAELKTVGQKKAADMRVRVGLTRPLEFTPAKQGIRTKADAATDLWMLETVSTGAKMVRLHFTGFNLPEGTKLYLAGLTGAEEVAVIEGKGPFGDGEFWSPIFAGDTIRLEMVHPASTEPKFQVTQIGHVFAAKLEPQEIQGCHLDAVCSPEWAEAGDAVTKIAFNDTGGMYVCSAVLVNNNSGDFSPLLLTANHCIGNEEVAKTVNTIWFYRSTSCNAGSISPTYTSYGAKFLAGNAASDATLLEVLGGVPALAKYAGWKIEAPVIGDAITGIHHPGGSHRRISFGSILADIPVRADFHHVIYSSGMAEGGSSGSPLFNAAGQVLGQLYGGNASCTNQSGDVLYGKLGVSYPFFLSPGGKNYLQEGLPDDVFHPNHTRATAAVLEGGVHPNLIARTNYEDWYEIKPPAHYLVTVFGTGPFIADLRLEGYRNLEETPFAARTNTFFPVLDFTGSSGGATRYYVRVANNGQNPTRRKYSLEVTVARPPTPAVSYFELWGAAEDRASGRAWVSTHTDATLIVEYSQQSTFSDLRTKTIPVAGRRFDTQFILFDLDGLTAGTTYYYRVALDNGLEVVRPPGPRQFTTPATTIIVDKTLLDFGLQKARTTATQVLTVTNSGAGMWIFSQVVFQIGGFTNNHYSPFSYSHTCGVGLPPGGTCTVKIHFTPWYLESFYGDARIESNSLVKSAQLLGRGSGAMAYVEDAATEWRFNFIVGAPVPPRRFRFRAYGDQPIELSNLSVSSPFYLVTNECPTALPAQGGCYFSVSYKPLVAGNVQGKIEVSHSGLDGPASFTFAEGAFDLKLSVARPKRTLRGSAPTAAVQTFDLSLATAGVEGDAQLGCSGALPGMSCSVSPAAIRLAGGMANATVTVTTAPRSQRLRTRTTQNVVLKVHATVQGMTRTIDLPVQIER